MRHLISINLTICGLMLACYCLADPLPEEIKIQVTIPNEPPPGTRIQLITNDVKTDREKFIEFYNSTMKVGMSGPSKIESSNDAHKIMTITFWGVGVSHGKTFYLLKNNTGDWISEGYGGVEIYDDPEGFPEYKYSSTSINALKEWYEKNIPEERRKR